MVDDDPDFVLTTKIILESGGYDTRTAANDKEALAQLEKEKPDIILLDVMMKTIGDGVWLGQKIKGDERYGDIPILMITAVNKESGTSSFHLDPNADGNYLPVDGFLEKPVEPEVLLREVARLIKQ
jgi:CheY-like chemotaxis protein